MFVVADIMKRRAKAIDSIMYFTITIRNTCGISQYIKLKEIRKMRFSKYSKKRKAGRYSHYAGSTREQVENQMYKLLSKAQSEQERQDIMQSFDAMIHPYQ